MKIVIIGSGNIATFFGKKFHEAGFKIIQIVSADLSHAEALAAHFKCDFSDKIGELNPQGDVYLFAVKDDILLEMAKTLSLPNKLLIHTAGSIHLNEIARMSAHVACIWCVYSINRNQLPLNLDIPLVLNASSKEDIQQVTAIAQAISNLVYYLSDQQKSTLHLAAVFANNFTNHLYTISKEIVEKEGIPFEILYPIISDTATKVLNGMPEKNQTGPAFRNDTITIEKHLNLLKKDASKQVYRILSDSIQSQGK